MPARTLFWLNTTDANEPFGVASSWTTTKGSSTPAATAPTSIDDTEIDTTATVSGSGSANVLNINAPVTIAGSMGASVTNATTIGNSAAGSVTIGAGSSWTVSHQLIVGGAATGQVTITGGGSLTTDSDISNSGSSFDDIGFGGGVGSVLVTGAGSKWTSNAAYALGVGSTGTLSITDGGEVQQTRASYYGGFFLAGGSMSVDSTSIAEAGTLGGAKAGYLTIDPNSWSGGIGTYSANIIDNGELAATDAGGFQGNGTLTVDGSITGTGALTVEAQETLALNGAVNLTGNGSVDFYGWYGTLAIDDAPGFSSTMPIYNFMPGDTIDLKKVPFVSADSSYSFTYGSNGGPNDLKITEGGQTFNLNVGSYDDLTGLLTLKADASGTGTDIVYTSGAASPLQQWGSTLPNFFSTASGPVDGSYWGISNSDDGSQPVWIETETPASSYVAGQSEPYSIVLTTQDWVGTEQPLVTVKTTNLIDPFGSNPQGLGNLAGSVYVSNGDTGTMDLIYWQASTTPGDYAVEFQPDTTTYVNAPSSGPTTVLTGGPTQIDAAVSQPLSWNLTNNYTDNSAATEDFLGYSTFATATTENIYLQGVSTSGVASTPVLAATIANGTWWGVSYNNSNGNFYYVYYSATGASGAGFYSETFNTSTGALGAPSAYLLTPGLTSVSSETGVTLSDGTHLRMVEGFQGTQQVIQAFVGNGSPSPVETFDLNSATPDRFAITTVTDPNDGYADYTVLAYTDDNQVHLELLNNYGDQIGSDLVVPGITSFDRLHSLFNSAGNDYRVELDYTVPDPKGGTQIEGIIYDTSPTGDYTTLGGGAGEYVGTPFDDTFIDAPGNYTINGGGDQDIFQINQTSNQVLFSLSSSQQLAVSTYSSTALTSANLTGTTTLKGFTRINLNDRSILESTSAGGGMQLEIQGSSNFAGTIAGFAAGDSIAFDGVTYAAGDHAVFTSNASGGGTVAIDNSGGSQVASFNVEGYYPWVLATVGQGTGGVAVVSAPTTPPPVTNHLVFQNTDGQATIWAMDGSSLVGGGPVSPNPGPSWNAIGTGDFSKDGQPDILWQNQSTGQVSVWEMNGSSLIGGGPVNPNPGTAWQAIGTGDFTDDGFSDDIVFQNKTTGQVSIWEMNGNELTGGGPVSPNPGPAWQAIGTGDFNHDGFSDLLFQNKTTGQVSIWEMDGNKLIGGGPVSPNPGTAWQAIGTGDFNKDGHSDILFQNKNTGQVSIWEMNGNSLTGGGPVNPNPGTSWHAIGTNGGSDILFQNTSGQTSIWDMSGATLVGGGPVSPNPGTSWRAVDLT